MSSLITDTVARAHDEILGLVDKAIDTLTPMAGSIQVKYCPDCKRDTTHTSKLPDGPRPLGRSTVEHWYCDVCGRDNGE